MASESTGWPLAEAPTVESAPIIGSPQRARRGPRRPGWFLAVLAFVCGGLVSAAGFSIGWRHQAQQGNEAQAKLATATARNHSLRASLATARDAEARARLAEKRARASRAAAEAAAAAAASAAGEVAKQATALHGAAATVSGDTGALASSTAKLESELKTLTTYLTTTPTGQLDAGYIQSQTTYLTRQLSHLQSAGGNVGDAVAAFNVAAKKLTQRAAALAGGH